jgi:hypothetical protein
VNEKRTYTQYKHIKTWRINKLLAQVNTYERLGWKTTSFNSWVLFKKSALMSRTREVEVG